MKTCPQCTPPRNMFFFAKIIFGNFMFGKLRLKQNYHRYIFDYYKLRKPKHYAAMLILLWFAVAWTHDIFPDDPDDVLFPQHNGFILTCFC